MSWINRESGDDFNRRKASERGDPPRNRPVKRRGSGGDMDYPRARMFRGRRR